MNVERCRACGKDFIAEEFSNHLCKPQVVPYEKIVTLYYSMFIPLRVNGEDVAILASEDGKTLYNIKPSPRATGQSFRPREDGTQPVEPLDRLNRTAPFLRLHDKETTLA